jgi:DNA-binding GntR family transcriptional regulator
VAASDERLAYNRVKRADRRAKDNDPFRVNLLMRSAFRRGLLDDEQSLTETALVTRFGATRESVRHSLRQFTDDGLIRRQPRSGTWFTAEPGRVLGDRMFPLLRGTRSDVSTIVSLEETIIPGSRIMCEILEVGDVDFVRYDQLILAHGLPSAVRTSYVPEPYLAGRRISDLFDPSRQGHDPQYESDFEMIFGVALGRVDSTIEAALGMRPIQALGTDVGDLLLNRETLSFDVEDVPRMLSFTSYKASVTSIQVSGDFRDAGDPRLSRRS